jgi:hypothetical protein
MAKIYLNHSGVNVKFLLLIFFVATSLHAVDFTKDIKPIFDDRCAKCHGEKKQKSDFRLDSRDSILKGGDLGEPAATPGYPEKSTLIKLISLDEDHDDIMPPKGDPLSKEQIALINTWIKEGAKMPAAKIAEAETLWSHKPVIKPAVETTANPVDALLEKKLQEKGLTFSQQANPRTLLRRLQVTLTGILPTTQEAATFIKNWKNNPDTAYKNKVEELLASEHYGERLAQHWLDAIRWAETSGSESNLYRKNSWKYRDYVIHSFNKDKPYDRFIIDQLAGDQTGFPRATGFMVAGPHVPPATVGQEVSAIKEARYDRLDQVMQTVGASMMGMTLGCARCHTHKFDPIKINDYYAILANFQGLEFGIRQPELGDHAPAVKRGKAIMAELQSQRKNIKSEVWMENWTDSAQVHIGNKKIKGMRLSFGGKKANIDEINFFEPSGKEITELANISTNMTGPRAEISKLTDGNIGNFFAMRGEIPAKQKGLLTFTFDQPTNVSHLTISTDRKKINNTDYEIWPSLPGGVPNFKVEIQDLTGKWITLTKSIHSQKAPKAIQELISRYRNDAVQHEFIGRFIKPVKTNVLLRGSPNSLGAEVAPNALATITKTLNMSSDISDKERRMKFAQWLASKQNPLTARVMVNRLWHHTFGTGIVSTLSDFGNAGAPPSHPELLDYLAADFMEKDWSVKNVMRLLVHSKAFKQDNKPITAALKKDANARLLWRFPPRRAEAEVLRDSVLKFTASLKTEIGGISYRIHNTKKRYALWDVVDNHSESTWRRMIYQERMRGIDDRMFTAFDFPDCGQVLSKRPSSTTPLQALNLMNSQFMVTQGGILANNVHSSDKKESITKLFQIVYNRQPDAKEMAMSLELLKSEGMHILCRALLNSNEFVFIQ